MTEREAFERWFSEDFMSGLDGAGEFDEERNCYVTFEVHMAWKGWKASRQQALSEAAILVEKGDPPSKRAGGRVEIGPAARCAISDAIRSLTSPIGDKA